MERLFCLQLEASCLQWSFLLTIDHFSFFTYSWSFFAYSFSFLTYSWNFFAYSGKVRLIRALRDCKQRSLTVSKEAPTVSKKASPFSLSLTTPPPPLPRQTAARPTAKSLISVHFGSVRLRFGSVSGPLGGVGMGSGRGASAKGKEYH